MSRPRLIALLTAITLFALLIHGYHPYSEDGGLYLAGVQRLLNPHLFPAYTDFVAEHQRFSLFAPFVAALTRATRLPLPDTVLLLHVATLWLTLYAAWLLATRLTPSQPARITTAALLAIWLTLPIAGTSLILFDPYLTARSFSTPLSLLAVAFTLDRKLILTTLLLVLAALVHPLMAAYTFAAILILLITQYALPLDLDPLLPAFHPLYRSAAKRRIRLWLLPLSLLFFTLVAAAEIQHLAPPEPPAYQPILLSRYYWFPFWWHWYEQLGLIAPLFVLYLLRHRTPILTRATLTLALISLTVGALFARVHLQTHLVARLQPLRAYHLIYILMILLLGAWLGETILRTNPWRWAVLLLTLPPIMFYVQRQAYPASPHLELPWTLPTNPYVQAFHWARANTPENAVFAQDPHYITAPGEDAQNFRPIAQRSALPDYSKDGGEASITPSLTAQWTQAQLAQANLNTQTDPERQAKLRPLGVTWLVLASSAATAFPCPYTNPTVKLCRMPTTSPKPQ